MAPLETQREATENSSPNKENMNPVASPAKVGAQEIPRKRVPLADCTDAHPGFATIGTTKSELPCHNQHSPPRKAFDRAMAGVHKTVPYVSPSKRRSSPDKRLAAAYTKNTRHLDFEIYEDSNTH